MKKKITKRKKRWCKEWRCIHHESNNIFMCVPCPYNGSVKNEEKNNYRKEDIK